MSNVVTMRPGHQHKWYVLDGKTVLPVSYDDWVKWMSSGDYKKHIANDVFGEVRVSTIFLGSNHDYGFCDVPQLFETMILGGEHDQWGERCALYDQAIEMHAKACAMVRGAAS
jgi:hypothetical protein